jgi:hypothetical protein
MAGDPTSDRRYGGIYHVVQWVFGADLVIGLVLAAAGYWLWGAVEIWVFGLGLAAVGLSMLLLFAWLRRQAEARDQRPNINRH